MVAVNVKFSLTESLFRIEDKIIRKIRKLPESNRRNSFPFFSSDTYFFLCENRIDRAVDIESGTEIERESNLYINGNLFLKQGNKILKSLSERDAKCRIIVLGDTDISPCTQELLELKRYSDQVFCVNLIDEVENAILAIPLGLESQRYRSAGQIRDFSGNVDLTFDKREIGILVAWNDATNPKARLIAREELAPLPFTTQVTKRITARSIHRLMRRSLFVACPRGNGLDTHRFWESTYLGAIPIILKADKIPAFDFAPHLTITSWREMNQFSSQDLRIIYEEKSRHLFDYSKKSRNSLREIFGDMC